MNRLTLRKLCPAIVNIVVPFHSRRSAEGECCGGAECFPSALSDCSLCVAGSLFRLFMSKLFLLRYTYYHVSKSENCITNSTSRTKKMYYGILKNMAGFRGEFINRVTAGLEVGHSCASVGTFFDLLKPTYFEI